MQKCLEHLLQPLMVMHSTHSSNSQARFAKPAQSASALVALQGVFVI